jgi:hypothetical protein
MKQRLSSFNLERPRNKRSLKPDYAPRKSTSRIIFPYKDSPSYNTVINENNENVTAVICLSVLEVMWRVALSCSRYSDAAKLPRLCKRLRLTCYQRHSDFLSLGPERMIVKQFFPLYLRRMASGKPLDRIMLMGLLMEKNRPPHYATQRVLLDLTREEWAQLIDTLVDAGKGEFLYYIFRMSGELKATKLCNADVLAAAMRMARPNFERYNVCVYQTLITEFVTAENLAPPPPSPLSTQRQ